MNSKHYDVWKKSRQIEARDFDIADAVMEQVNRKTCRESGLKSSLNSLLASLINAGAFVRACVVVSGALAGLLRMMLVYYYALFA